MPQFSQKQVALYLSMHYNETYPKEGMVVLPEFKRGLQPKRERSWSKTANSTKRNYIAKHGRGSALFWRYNQASRLA